ncbi:MAG: hypothetical protein P8O79_09620, partial [Halieaceae bacterium]|nr:hypothetical protein [Halieaceae bacterium]
MKTPRPQQEFQKLAYLKALGIQPLVLARQPACGVILPRAVPAANAAGSASPSSAVDADVTVASGAKQAHVAGGNPTASLAAVRESLLGVQTRSGAASPQVPSAPEAEVSSESPEVEKALSMAMPKPDDQGIEADDSH